MYFIYKKQINVASEKVDYCNITNLLDNEEFIKEFKLYLGD